MKWLVYVQVTAKPIFTGLELHKYLEENIIEGSFLTIPQAEELPIEERNLGEY